jgi:hypothetical protein
MSICNTVQNLLADEGVEAVRRDTELARHFDGCADCQQVRDALLGLDEALAALPT